jgi:hypothetical protein
MGVTCVGLTLLVLVGQETPMAGVVGCLVVLGLGFAFFSSPNTKAIMSAVERRTYGVASAVVGTMRQVGMTLSMGTVMVILAVQLGEATVDATNAERFIDCMRVALMLFAVLCLAGVLASLARGTTEPR